MKVTVLLGAGASKGAGVPISAEMTAALLDRINARSKPLLHFVYGGLLMQEAANAHFDGSPIVVDAEGLFNAVEALANRATFNAAPFVASWHPLIDQFVDNRSDDLEREIKLGLDRMRDSWGIDRFARILANAIKQGRGSSNLFPEVAEDMVSTLNELLAVSDASRIEYLTPLLDLHEALIGGLVIASLNYDTLIEQLGEVHSVRVDDCLDYWVDSGSIGRSNDLTLLKLHGSINWAQDPDGSVRRAKVGSYMRPALIFGGINKLRADGPYLEMLWEWRSHLDKCDHLVIIGYSFRDAHVNAIINRWHRQDAMKRITIIDPGYDPTNNDLTHNLYMLSNEQLGPFVTVGNTRNQSNDRPEAPRSAHQG